MGNPWVGFFFVLVVFGWVWGESPNPPQRLPTIQRWGWEVSRPAGLHNFAPKRVELKAKRVAKTHRRSKLIVIQVQIAMHMHS